MTGRADLADYVNNNMGCSVESRNKYEENKQQQRNNRIMNTIQDVAPNLSKKELDQIRNSLDKIDD